MGSKMSRMHRKLRAPEVSRSTVSQIAKSKIGMGATLSANAIHLNDVNMIVEADPPLYLSSTIAGSRPIYAGN